MVLAQHRYEISERNTSRIENSQLPSHPLLGIRREWLANDQLAKFKRTEPIAAFRFFQCQFLLQLHQFGEVVFAASCKCLLQSAAAGSTAGACMFVYFLGIGLLRWFARHNRRRVGAISAQPLELRKAGSRL